VLHRRRAKLAAGGGPCIAVGHVNQRPLGPRHDRPDAEPGALVDQRVDREAEEVLDPLALQDVGDRRGGIHRTTS